jgi:hypothetical protein
MRSLHAWLAMVVAFSVGFFALASSGLEVGFSNLALFWLTVVITLMCAAFALGLLAIARHVDQPELGVLAAALFATSLFPFVHGLNIPGVLTPAETGATTFTAWVALPATLLLALPSLVDNRLAHKVLKHWRPYS